MRNALSHGSGVLGLRFLHSLHVIFHKSLGATLWLFAAGSGIYFYVAPWATLSDEVSRQEQGY